MTIALLIATAFLAAVLASSLIPLRLMVLLSGAFATLQLYTVPLGGVFFSASHLGGLGAWRSLLGQKVKTTGWFSIVVLLIGWQAAAAIWSPSPYLAIRQVFYWLPFVFVIPAVVQEASKNPKLIEKIISFVLLSTLIQVVLVVIFRFAPSIESAFLGSPIARFFVSPNVLGELRNGAYTIFDPAKAGGFFVNANVGATFMGMCAFIAWGFARSTGKQWAYWVAIINLLATLLTGSKAGALLAVGLPLAAYAIFIFRAGRISIKLVAALCIVGAIALPAFLIGLQYFLESRFVAASSDTFSERLAIWDFAFQVLKNHPLLGLGFGGWEQEWPVYALGRGLNPLFPPHNSLIALFVQSGIVTVVLAISFCASYMWHLWKLAGRRDKTGAFALGLFFSVVWAFTQSMGENFGILGESHITPLLALATGYLLHLSETQSDKRID